MERHTQVHGQRTTVLKVLDPAQVFHNLLTIRRQGEHASGFTHRLRLHFDLISVAGIALNAEIEILVVHRVLSWSWIADRELF
jgi:hypothetical protein